MGVRHRRFFLYRGSRLPVLDWVEAWNLSFEGFQLSCRSLVNIKAKWGDEMSSNVQLFPGVEMGSQMRTSVG